MSNAKVLYVGGDAHRSAWIRSSLKADGFLVRRAADTEAVIDARGDGYVVAIVDWNQSGTANGLEIGRQLRDAAPETGIILCGTALNWRPRWRALAEACDEHLTSPFSSWELLARVHRTVARKQRRDGSADSARPEPLVVDFLRQCVRVDGREIELQPLQLRLLGYLISHTGRSVSNEELRTQVFRVVQGASSTSIARQICVLRRQLGDAAAHIVTTRGGYAFDVTKP